MRSRSTTTMWLPTRPSAALLAVLLAAGGCAGAAPEPGGPQGNEAEFIALMLDDGWWLHVRRDGSHAIGYGALPARIAVRSGAIDFARVHDLVAPHARPATSGPRGDAACRYTATFGGPAGHDGRVHTLPPDLCDELAHLFRSAWTARSTGAVPGDAEVIERAWRRAPFLDPGSRARDTPLS